MAKEGETPRINPAAIENLIGQIRGTNLEPGAKEKKGVTEFFSPGAHYSEFENRRLLPIDDAIRAIVEFFESGHRPSRIRWVENKF